MTKSAHPIIDPVAVTEAQKVMGQKFIKVLNYYFEDTENYLHAIDSGLASGDVVAIVNMAHTIKSSSIQMGACEMGRLAAQLEMEGKRILSEATISDAFSDLATSLKDIFKTTKLQLIAIGQVTQ